MAAAISSGRNSRGGRDFMHVRVQGSLLQLSVFSPTLDGTTAGPADLPDYCQGITTLRNSPSF